MERKGLYFSGLAALTVLSILLAWKYTPVEVPATPRRPNIIIILADDMGFSDPGCYGGEINRGFD